MAAPLNLVAKNLRWSARAGDEQIHCAIIVEIADGESAPDRCNTTEFRVSQGDITKNSVSIVSEKLVALGIRSPEARRIRQTALHPAIHERQIDCAVIIEINQGRAEARTAPGLFPHGRDSVLKKAARFLSPKAMILLREMSHKQIKQTVAIHVADGDAHIAGRLAESVKGQATFGRFF